MKAIQFDTESIDQLIDPNNPNRSALFSKLKAMIQDAARSDGNITLSTVIKPDPVMMYLLPSTLARKQEQYAEYENKLNLLLEQLQLSDLNITTKIVERADESSVSFSTEDRQQAKALLARILEKLFGGSEKKNASIGVSTYKQAMNQSGQATTSTSANEETTTIDNSLTTGSFTTLSTRKLKQYPTNEPSTDSSATKPESDNDSHLPKKPGIGSH